MKQGAAAPHLALDEVYVGAGLARVLVLGVVEVHCSRGEWVVWVRTSASAQKAVQSPGSALDTLRSSPCSKFAHEGQKTGSIRSLKRWEVVEQAAEGLEMCEVELQSS